MRPTGPEVDSFYHLAGVDLRGKVCSGLACFAARGMNPAVWARGESQDVPLYCLGRCHSAPSSTDDRDDPHIEAVCDHPIVLAGVDSTTHRAIGGYLSIGGYAGLKKAITHTPEEVIAEIEASGLRGRGGAGFPAGRKWRSVLEQQGSEKYVVANADEGDHGSYIDRFIMERTPHRLIEAMAIAGYAVGANKGVIYLRKEYPEAKVALERAIDEALEYDFLGDKIAGSKFRFHLEICMGKGSYVCGEETSLLNSIEHVRAEVRARPPYPTVAGLYGKPTLVNNVETLGSAPWIVLHGGAAYATRGFSKSRGTKAISLNSLFNRPGLYEVEFGVTLRHIFDEIGGGLKTGSIKLAIVGGPMVGVVHPSEFDTPMGFDELLAVGATVGHGGIIAFDESTRIIDLMVQVFRFGAFESCGKCTPCRVGSGRALGLLEKAAIGASGSGDLAEFERLVHALRLTSLCGHGGGLGEFAQSVLNKFGEEVRACFA